MTNTAKVELGSLKLEKFSLDEAIEIFGNLEPMYWKQFRYDIYQYIKKCHTLHEGMKKSWEKVGSELHPLHEYFMKKLTINFDEDDIPENLKNHKEFKNYKYFQSNFEMFLWFILEQIQPNIQALCKKYFTLGVTCEKLELMENEITKFAETLDDKETKDFMKATIDSVRPKENSEDSDSFEQGFEFSDDDDL